MRGLKTRDLQAILEYTYHGEMIFFKELCINLLLKYTVQVSCNISKLRGSLSQVLKNFMILTRDSAGVLALPAQKQRTTCPFAEPFPVLWCRISYYLSPYGAK